jgi:hypothetical protein
MGRVVTKAVRPSVQPATMWVRVISKASARLIAGNMVVRRRARIDCPAPEWSPWRGMVTERRAEV